LDCRTQELHVTGVIESLGPLGVFLLMVPESACVPIPSELTLLFSGFAVHQGWMSFPLAVVAATTGNVVGSLIAYVVGATHALDRLPFVGKVLNRWERLLARHGTRAVFVARLLPLARTFVSLPAGARRVGLPTFVVFTTAGCALWATGFVLAGLLAAGAWETIGSFVGRVALAVGLLALGASVLGRRR
jgi:membrane protein DedA with SNARE-associated domain